MLIVEQFVMRINNMLVETLRAAEVNIHSKRMHITKVNTHS